MSADEPMSGAPADALRAEAAANVNATALPGNSDLATALDMWRKRLVSAGVVSRGVAMHSADPGWSLAFAGADALLAKRWSELCKRVSSENPVALEKASAATDADMLMAMSVQLPTGQIGVAGIALPPPHHERTIQLVLLSLGWLQLALSAASLAHNQRAAALLELMGHVGSQTSARAAAQEWINRAATWARAEAPGLDAGFTLFEVRGGMPRWWVAADTAWAEKASPAVREASEIATRAVVEMQEIDLPPWWALPLMSGGEPVAVLVARLSKATDGLPAQAAVVLRASAALGEPLLRQWHTAERGLHRHLLATVREGWRKLTGPGHLTWKIGSGALVVALAVLLLWPVADRVTAHAVIEGRTRQIVTAPFDGFIAQVLVRPGESVVKGQLLARLDDRELKLEQNKYTSERDQAAGKLRQAMAARDAAAMAAAQADVQQAEAQLALVESKLARAGLMAPMDGLVVTGDWAQQIGGPVETGKEMFEVATTDGYRVVLHVPDRDIVRVKAGQQGILRLTGQPQVTYDFEVERVTATARVEDGVNGFRVESEWRGNVPALSPGMQGVGKIQVSRTNLLTLWTRSSVDWLRLKWWGWWW
jgi:biotin carboxyl carrier protein